MSWRWFCSWQLHLVRTPLCKKLFLSTFRLDALRRTRTSSQNFSKVRFFFLKVKLSESVQISTLLLSIYVMERRSDIQNAQQTTTWPRQCSHFCVCFQIVNCPRLMKVIFDEFLPLSWSWDVGEARASEDQVAYGRPQPAAVSLLFSICSAGRNLTAQLVRRKRAV